jgi:hypothetical protein
MAEEIGASLRVTEHAAGTRAGCGMFDVMCTSVMPGKR